MKSYRKKHIQQMEPWCEGYDMSRVSVSQSDKDDGSPTIGDMIAVNAQNTDDRWLVAEAFFIANYEGVSDE